MCNHLHGTIQVSKKYRQQSSYSKKGDEGKILRHKNKCNTPG